MLDLARSASAELLINPGDQFGIRLAKPHLSGLAAIAANPSILKGL
jgi:hypothetical protein